MMDDRIIVEISYKNDPFRDLGMYGRIILKLIFKGILQASGHIYIGADNVDVDFKRSGYSF
jgi:hypothetical protein